MCACARAHAYMCLLVFACLQVPTVDKGDSDYFRPMNALFILALSLGLELIAADYTVWKRKDSHQQFGLADKNIVMQNKTGS